MFTRRTQVQLTPFFLVQGPVEGSIIARLYVMGARIDHSAAREMFLLGQSTDYNAEKVAIPILTPNK